MSSVLTIPSSDTNSPKVHLRGSRVKVVSCHSDERIMFYEGQRIYLRPLELEDELLLRKFVNDPANWRFLRNVQPLNGVREREWIESLGKSGTDYVFGITLKQGDRLIGVAGLHQVNWVNRSAVFGINIGDTTQQGRGYGREATQLVLRYAFEELNLNRVELSVYADNWRAIRLYQKVGFVAEGCARQARYSNGRYQDEYRFGILRSEWEALYGREN
ncbi:MAG TPA: GNAT family protein [Phycisphaerae bacterium]|nr:GNAT family protein [Phycisphaerae bacterium]HPZ99527.1 GNAT family protein [Phycisphaerae bacterium]HQE30158.1 GNAT family protein [Phycisphaerae bacterium]